ncbi:hypothetical protein QQX98_011995 [Neonectria punicea]|uniref:Metallothionein n=1 Tax=Neonectria punicea TaxID=979145 RepID=A0ABR1GK95_9HYPO
MFSGDLAYIRPPRRRASTSNTIEMRSWAEIERRRSEGTAASRAKTHRTKRLNASVVKELRHPVQHRCDVKNDPATCGCESPKACACDCGCTEIAQDSSKCGYCSKFCN